MPKRKYDTSKTIEVDCLKRFKFEQSTIESASIGEESTIESASKGSSVLTQDNAQNLKNVNDHNDTQLETLTERITSNVPEGLYFSTFDELLECFICRKRLITPYILHCSHTFCKKCIIEWLRVNKSCPTCKKMILKPPAHNKHVQHFLDICLHMQNEEAKQIYDARVREHQKFFDDELSRFKTVICNATQNGTRFLKIDRKWTDKEKRIFRIGLERYEGKELEVYCDLTGFTKAYIQSATPTQLLVAAHNVDAQIPQSHDSGINYELLREVLCDTIT
jgi:hypothetical protein